MGNGERCYCGDPDCGLCFPFSKFEPEDDTRFEIMRQSEVDDERFDRNPD